MTLISVEQADALIAEHFPRLPEEDVPLSEAGGRWLRRAALAERDHPPFDRITMDGIALASADFARGMREFTVAGVQAAGQAPMSLPGPGSCVEVMTGAVLPAGCDCVVPVEDLNISEGKARLSASARIEPGRFVHASASDHKAGTQLIAAGSILNPPAVAVLASCGYGTVTVAARPRVCIIATGDELVTNAEMPEPHQIRSSNAPAMAAAIRLHGWGSAHILHLPDQRGLLEAGIAKALDENDLLIMSGGVSRGRFDFVPEVLASLNVTSHFHGVSQRPGKPLWFGTREHDAKVVFGLPGNPVSSLVCLHRYVLPALVQAGGGTFVPGSVRLGEALRFTAPLTWYVPVKLWNQEGVLLAEPRIMNTSGDFAALSGTDGFAALPRDKARFPKGFLAQFYAWGRC